MASDQMLDIFSLNNMDLNMGYFMMTSSNLNIFRVTGLLCGEFTGHRWIPHTKAIDAELWCFLDLRLNENLAKQWRRRWYEITVMLKIQARETLRIIFVSWYQEKLDWPSALWLILSAECCCVPQYLQTDPDQNPPPCKNNRAGNFLFKSPVLSWRKTRTRTPFINTVSSWNQWHHKAIKLPAFSVSSWPSNIHNIAMLCCCISGLCQLHV